MRLFWTSVVGIKKKRGERKQGFVFLKRRRGHRQCDATLFLFPFFSSFFRLRTSDALRSKGNPEGMDRACCKCCFGGRRREIESRERREREKRCRCHRRHIHSLTFFFIFLFLRFRNAPGIQPRSVSRMLTKKDVPIPLTRKTASGGRRMAQTTSTSVVKTPPILAGRGKQIGMKKKSNLEREMRKLREGNKVREKIKKIFLLIFFRSSAAAALVVQPYKFN